MEEQNLIRKCATVLSKLDNKLEIMDLATFRTIKAEIDETLFNQAEINDSVTYVEAEDFAKVLEIRKR